MLIACTALAPCVYYSQCNFAIAYTYLYFTTFKLYTAPAALQLRDADKEKHTLVQ